MSKCLIGNISEEIMKTLNIDYGYMGDEDMNVSMKELVDQCGKKPKAFKISTPFVYMDEVEEDKMSDITHMLKEQGIKAIYVASTAYNRSWTLSQLLNEVLQEHQLFQTMNQLKMQIQEVMKEHANERNEKVEEWLMAAFVALQKKDQALMDQMLIKLKQL